MQVTGPVEDSGKGQGAGGGPELNALRRCVAWPEKMCCMANPAWWRPGAQATTTMYRPHADQDGSSLRFSREADAR
jgi:hypothetical protein